MRTYVILFRYDLIKDPVPESAVHIKVHTQIHSATPVRESLKMTAGNEQPIERLGNVSPATCAQLSILCGAPNIDLSRDLCVRSHWFKLYSGDKE